MCPNCGLENSRYLTERYSFFRKYARKTRQIQTVNQIKCPIPSLHRIFVLACNKPWTSRGFLIFHLNKTVQKLEIIFGLVWRFNLCCLIGSFHHRGINALDIIGRHDNKHIMGYKLLFIPLKQIQELRHHARSGFMGCLSTTNALWAMSHLHLAI